MAGDHKSGGGYKGGLRSICFTLATGPIFWLSWIQLCMSLFFPEDRGAVGGE